jgi:ubiquinone/menaquinone biosynthesis C-methylase UbiE
MKSKKLNEYAHGNQMLSIKINLDELYAYQNFSSCRLFSGDFINYGYWKNIDIGNDISDENRMMASVQLYNKIYNLFPQKSLGTLLEIGCGTGEGCLLAGHSLKYKLLVGVDAVIEQANLAQKKVSTLNTPALITHAFAENLPFLNNAFDAIISVEVLQHCSNLETVFNEVYRVLNNDGDFAFCMFFSKESTLENKMEIENLIPTVRDKIDFSYDINHIEKTLSSIGFQHITINPIGEHVWAGFNAWIMQTEFRNSWNKNWILAYEQGLLDYYVVHAKK